MMKAQRDIKNQPPKSTTMAKVHDRAGELIQSPGMTMTRKLKERRVIGGRR